MLTQGRSTKIWFAVVAALFACLATANSAHAGTVNYTFVQGQGPGSSLTYQGDVGGYSADVMAWTDLGSGTLEEASIAHEMTNGLGVCNSAEGAFATCVSKNNRPAMDNSGQQDWLLVYFDELVNITSFTVFPEGNQDRDVTYFTGLLQDPNDVANVSYANLVADPVAGGLGLTRQDVNFGKSTAAATVTLAAVTGADVYGNALLIGASLTSGADRILLNSVSTVAAPSVVPIPAAVWLFGSALFVLAVRRNNKQD